MVKEKFGRCVKFIRNNILICLDFFIVIVCLSEFWIGEYLYILCVFEFGLGDFIVLYVLEKLVVIVDRNKWGYLNVWCVWNL